MSITRTRMVFPDKSFVAWQDLENLRYTEEPYAVRVRVEFEHNIPSRRRILRRHSIAEWEKYPAGEDPEISESKREEIITKVCAYLGPGRVTIGP